MLDRYFRLSEHGTSLRIEMMAGLTTFLTMAYIIFVQPAVLSGSMFGFSTGMDFGAVMVATCLAAALATAIMGLYGRYPIALAPGMGENFFFVLTVIFAAKSAGMPNPWQAALGVVFVSGVLFYVLFVLGVREKILDVVSPDMKLAVAVGIGLFIAFIGLQNGGVIVTAASLVPAIPPFIAPGTLVKLNSRLLSPDMLVFMVGLIVTTVLHVRRVRGSILWGILAATAFAIGVRVLLPVLSPGIWLSPLVQQSRVCTHLRLPDPSLPVWTWIVSLPPSIAPTFLRMDILAAFTAVLLPFVFIFLFMDVFDTIGTLVGVAEHAGFMKDNKLPRAREAMLADQAGTVIGSVLGTSTVTSYIESIAGVEAGGRTGLTSLVVAGLFLLALFFSPLVALVGSCPAITAPALVLVGAMMVRSVSRINWDDYSESVPAFLTMVGIPLTYSISDGLAIGFISYPVVKALSGRGRQINAFMYVLAFVLLLYMLFVRKLAG